MTARVKIFALVLCLALLVAASAVQSRGPEKEGALETAARGRDGKAPVSIEGTAGPASGSVTLTFEAPATNVSILVYGSNGLQVGDQFNTTRDTVNAGTQVNLQPTYSGDAGYLVVLVRATYGQATLGNVKAFPVNGGGPQVHHPITEDGEGNPVLDIPVEGEFQVQ